MSYSYPLGGAWTYHRDNSEDHRKKKHQDHPQVRKFNDTPGEVVFLRSASSFEQAEAEERTNDIPPWRTTNENPRIPGIPPKFSAPLIGARRRDGKRNVSQNARKHRRPPNENRCGDDGQQPQKLLNPGGSDAIPELRVCEVW